MTPTVTAGAILEITSPRRLQFETRKNFTLRNNDVTIELTLIEQRQDGDAWIVTGKVVNTWTAKSQN